MKTYFCSSLYYNLVIFSDIDFYIGLPYEENYRVTHTYSPSLWHSLKLGKPTVFLFHILFTVKPDLAPLAVSALNPQDSIEVGFTCT